MTGRRAKQGGNMMIEGAITMIVFLSILFAILDLGRAVWMYNTLAHCAREASHYAMLNSGNNGTQATATDMKNIVTAQGFGLDMSSLTVSLSWVPNNSIGSTAKVVVACNFKPLTIWAPAISLSNTSQMVILH